MALAKKRLLDTTQLTSATPASNPMLSNPSGKTTLVQLLTAHNPGATDYELTVYRVPDDAGAVGTAGSANQVFKLTIPPGGTELLELSGGGWVLEDEGDSLQFAVSGAINLSLDGAEVS